MIKLGLIAWPQELSKKDTRDSFDGVAQAWSKRAIIGFKI